MECVRLKINEHMTSLGEEILCVLDADVCGVKLNVRVFVLERLSAAAQFMCNLFQREMETLDKRNKLLDIHPNITEQHMEASAVSGETMTSKKFSTEGQPETDQGRGPLDATMQPVVKLYSIDFVPVCREEVSPEEEERSSNLVEEESEPPHIKEEQEELLQRPEEAENVARGGQAAQSSGYRAKLLPPEWAIDGNRASDWSQNSCTHTSRETNPWWRVDLQNTYKVNSVTVTNRGDCCAERINGAEIRIGNSLNDNGNGNPRCAVIDSIPAGGTMTFECNGMVGQFVNIVIPGESRVLTLCEVEVFGTEDGC